MNIVRWGILFLVLMGVAAAQSVPLSGSYGFLANAYQIDSAGSNGAALLGLMNFDGAGNVSGTVTLKPRSPIASNNTGTGNFTGTYSSNPDGTVTATLTFPFGTFTFDLVATDGGQGFQFVSTDTFGGGEVMFQGSSPQSLSASGGLPVKLFNSALNGGMPVSSLTGVTPAGGGPTVYTATSTTGSGPVQCPDGSTGTWTGSLSNLTIVTNASGGSLAGNSWRLSFSGPVEAIPF